MTNVTGLPAEGGCRRAAARRLALRMKRKFFQQAKHAEPC
jgi:hypothetical protein